MRRELIDAINDYRFLLSRGYPVKTALDAVCTRYTLSKRERLLLYRCVHSLSVARLVSEKIGNPPRGTRLYVDGFNVLATIYAAYIGEHVYLCDDGIVRDLLGLHGRIAAALDRKFLKSIITDLYDYTRRRGYSLHIILDYNVKKSGETAALLRSLIRSNSVDWSVSVEKHADKKILELASTNWVSTSDIVILCKARSIHDLAGGIIREKYPKAIVKIPLENHI